MSQQNVQNEGGSFSVGAILITLRERFLHRLAILGFDLVILIAMGISLMAAALAMGGKVRIYQATVLLPMVCLGLTLFLRAKRNPSAWKEEVGHILRDWVPFLLIVFIYENLHDVAGQVIGFDFAEKFYNWDVVMFGFEPTVWAQNIFSPLLTDIMSISYALYFALPLFLMVLLSIWNMRLEFRRMALCVTLTFIMGFLGYVFLPTSPPRYFIGHLYTDPVKLTGFFLFNRLQGAWDGLSVISGGAFPSLHVGLSSVALLYAFRYRRTNRTCSIVWYAYIPLVTSLWFSTVYLRHHWVVDIFAGWAVALVAYFIADPMMRAWLSLRRRYNLDILF